MSTPARVFMDVSYTRTQDGNVGITRTVRRLADELRAHPVVFHSSGFRVAPATTETAARASGRDGLATRAFRSASQGVGRRIAAALPAGLLHRIWSGVSTRMFDAMSRREPRVAFRPGDWLVLADQSWNYAAWRAVARARREGAFTVLVVYDLIPLRHPEYCPPLFTRAFGAWLRAMLACCDAVVCISGATRDDLRRWCAEQRLTSPPMGHFRLGSDLPATPHAGTVRPEVEAFTRGASPFFAAVGSIEPRKNHRQLLDVFERLWEAGSDARLAVAGRPHPSCAAIAAQLQRPGRGDRLLTLFDASDAEIALLYERSRALVFPTLAEGFGLPLVEARTRGAPVIASDLPALAELADGGVDLFPPGDDEALARLVCSHAEESRRPSVGAMALFSWADSAAQLIARASRLRDPA
ncbi:MAG: glycosyltransferase family 1 protein [Pseudomonadota bacterium]